MDDPTDAFTGMGFLRAGRHQTLYVPTYHRRHAHNNSTGTRTALATPVNFVLGADILADDDNQPVALTHSFAYEGPQRARTISYHGPVHRPTRSLPVVPDTVLPQTGPLSFRKDKPLPMPPPQSPVREEDEYTRTPEPIDNNGGINTMSLVTGEHPDTLMPSTNVDVSATERVDVSIGSWLDDEGKYAHDVRASFLEDTGLLDLDDYLSRRPSLSPSPHPSTSTERPARQPRGPRLSAIYCASPQKSKSTEHIRDSSAFFDKPPTTRSVRSANPSMSSFGSHPHTQVEVGAYAKTALTRPDPEDDVLFDVSALTQQPKVDPSNFPDPYPHGISYHQSSSATPALSSAGSSSASTRSSAYTNPGSTISTCGYSGDYSHVRVASGEDFDGVGGIGILGSTIGVGMAGAMYSTEAVVVEKLARTSTGSSLSSGSRKSHGHTHAAHVPLPRMRHVAYTRTTRSLSQSQPEEYVAPPIPNERLERPLRSQPSYDTSWQRDHDEFGTSEEEYEYEEDEQVEDEQPCSAISVVEEGRSLIVRGEGMSVQSLRIQPGITHLLLGSSNTPNSIPAFLTVSLPQISTTLLALDISANYLVSLSPSLGSCTSLEELNISANPLRVLPEFLVHLTSLRLLLADSTGIAMMPASLAALDKLHTLSIRRNKMHVLPSWLCTLPCLENLLVDGNPFQGPWKALVEPLLAKAPMTPAYPPSTPMMTQLSATLSSTCCATTAESSDISDTEEYTDQDEANHDAPSALTSSSRVALASADENLEDDTITPAHARLLERSATSPTPLSPSFSPPPSRPLSRTRTAPNRAYYERMKQLRTQQDLSELAEPVDSSNDMNSPDVNVTNFVSPNLMLHPSRDLRRMRSADELRRAMSPVAGTQSTTSLLSPPTSPPRPGLRHYATNTSSTSGSSETTDGLSRRFASLNMHARASSRASVRPLAHNVFGETVREQDSDAEVERPPRTVSRAPAATSVSVSRGTRDEAYERQIRESLAMPRKEREKTGKKWGFLKKMSMGKLRSVESTSGTTSAPSSTRPSTSSGGSGNSLSRRVPAFSSASATPRQLSPQVEVALHPSEAINALSATRSTPPPSFATSNLSHNISSDKLKTASPSTALFAGLLAPPSPMSKSGKRRSFLPLDGPPSLNIPIPSSSPFLGGLTATNGFDDQEDPTRSQHSGPVVDSPLEIRQRDEELNRESNARALRSVMAYLRDMNDLTLLSQGNSLSMYGGSAPLMDRSRRPTVVDSQRMPSEASMDSIDTASSAPTTASSHMRSFDSFSGNRSGSTNTMSIATSDSGGSMGEERRMKDDRGKRLMIVREIVDTERTYVKNLQDLVNIYVQPAAAPVNSIGSVTSSSKESVVPASERKIVFGGLEALFTFHKESFFPALEAAAAPLLTPQGAAADADSDGKLSSDVAMSVGRIFVAHAAFMKMYSSYINNFESSVSRIRQWVSSDRSGPASAGSSHASSLTAAQLANAGLAMPAYAPSSAAHDIVSGRSQLTSSQRKRIKHYLKRCRMHPKHSQLNLEGYLLLPVQRIPRYRLLLEDLTRCTPSPESYDDPLDRALTEISSLATNMNEGKRDAESRRKLVMWQSRIRGKFPSPLVQPHRRLIMDGKLLLTRIVRKQTMAFEVLDSHGDASNVAVDCLAPELTPRPLYGVLCNDLFVLCRDPSNGQDPNSPVDLWAVLRMQTMPQPTSIVHGNTLRIVDTKAILYLEAPSTSEALTWFRAINMHVPTQKPEA